MKIITKATLYLEPGKPGIEPGEEVEIDDAEAQTMVARGLAEVASMAKSEANAKAAADAEAQAIAETEAAKAAAKTK